MESHVGPYRLLFRIATGGMAEVYAACRQSHGGFVRTVAIKRLHAHLADDARFVDMFLDEARVAATISSPNVVQVLDQGRDERGLPFLAMDLVVGVTLGQLVSDSARLGRIVECAVGAEILAGAAEGLHAAHEASSAPGKRLAIVHRDVSPQNVLVGVDGRSRVADFGVARAREHIASTHDGDLKGKFRYFSPEQARGEPLDLRSDVFSLGVVAYELFAGRALFGSQGGATAVLERVKSMPIPSLATVRSDLTPAVVDAIQRSLERDPSRRFQTAHDLALALAPQGLAETSNERLGRVALYLASVSEPRITRLQTSLERTLAEVERNPTTGVIAIDNEPTEIDTALPELEPSAPDARTPPLSRRSELRRPKPVALWATGLTLLVLLGAAGVSVAAFGSEEPAAPATPHAPTKIVSAPAPVLPEPPRTLPAPAIVAPAPTLTAPELEPAPVEEVAVEDRPSRTRRRSRAAMAASTSTGLGDLSEWGQR